MPITIFAHSLNRTIYSFGFPGKHCMQISTVQNKMSSDAIDHSTSSCSSSGDCVSMGALRLKDMDRDENTENAMAGKLALIPMEKSHKPKKIVSMLRSLFSVTQLPTPCKWWRMPGGPSDYPSIGSRVTGTLFGYRKGHVHFAVQEDPRSQPVLLIEFATSTNSLVKEMASGLVRIALECERTCNRGRLFQEPIWTMYCNGRRTGYAMKRNFSGTDMQILGLVQAVSMGAGVLPIRGGGGGPDGELMYMRARFERVVGSRDSEAYYMMNPDGTGGPELSIFLLRI